MVGQKVVNEVWQKFVQWMKGGRWSRGWMVVSGLRYRDQTNRNRPSSKRFIPILNSKKERIKELET